MFTGIFKGLQFFYSPDDNLGAGDDVTDDDKNVDDDNVEDGDSSDDGDDDDKSNDVDEDKDEDVEEDEDDDEDDEEAESLVKFSYQDLKSAFKDKPELLKAAKSAFFREQEFSKIFDNPKEAEEAAAKANNYQALTELVLSGNTEELLKQIDEVNPKSLKSFAGNFLPDLQKLNPDLYRETVKPVITDLLHTVLAYGKKHNDEDLQNSAKLISKLLYDDYDPPKVDKPTKSDKEENLDKKEQEILNREHQKFVSSVYDETLAILDKEIEKDLDPGKVLEKRPKLKARMVKTIREEILSGLESDTAHMARMNALLMRERRSGYAGTLKESIKTAFLSRAKVLLPKIRRDVRVEFLGAMKNDDKNKKNKMDSANKNRLAAGAGDRGNKKPLTVKEARDRKLTEMDIIRGNY